MGFSLLVVRAVLASVVMMVGGILEPVYGALFTYTYKGNNFSTIQPLPGNTPYTEATFVTIRFTIDSPTNPIAAITGTFGFIDNFRVLKPEVVDFSISDGFQTFTKNDFFSDFEVSGDSNGNITQWKLNVANGSNQQLNRIISQNQGPNHFDQVFHDPNPGVIPFKSAHVNSSGVWTLTSTQSKDLSFSKDTEDLKTIITQAVYDTKKLVLNRKTRILAKVLATPIPFSGTVKVTAALAGKLIGEATVLFSNQTEQDVEISIPQLDVGLNQELVLTIDPDGQIAGEDNSNNLWRIPGFDVIETKPMPVEYAFLRTPACKYDTSPCLQAESEISNFIQLSNQFIQDVYPVPDASQPNSNNFHDLNFASPNFGTVTVGGCAGGQDIPDGWVYDLITVNRMRSFLGAKKGVGLVPGNYFEQFSMPTARGVHYFDPSKPAGVLQGAKHAVLVEIENKREWIPAHEIGHSFGFGEGYNQDCSQYGDPSDNKVEGFQTRNTPMEVAGAFDFMDNPNELIPGTQKPWVNTDHWNQLVDGLNVNIPDPELLMINGVIRKNGTIELLPWDNFMGIPDAAGDGQYSIILKDIQGNQISESKFEAIFQFNAEGLGIMTTDASPISFTIPYPAGAATVEILRPDGTIMATVDPAIKALQDAVAQIPDACFVGNPEQDRPTMVEIVTQFKTLLGNKEHLAAINLLETQIIELAETTLVPDCNDATILETSREKLLIHLHRTIQHLDARIVNSDQDRDGVFDDQDICPVSDLSSTVLIGGQDSGVANTVLSTGCSITDLIAQCGNNSGKHGKFVSCVSHVTNDLKKKGIISGKEKGAIQKAAAETNNHNPKKHQERKNHKFKN